jgi:iron complex outermembrane receptor protein
MHCIDSGFAATSLSPLRHVVRAATARVGITLFSCGFLFAPSAHAAVKTADLKQLSLEELMDVEVTSVSRTSEDLGRAAAAIAVITNEDIRRSGATSIPEVLRLVPGVNVARRNTNVWAVSARGFSSVSSEKLLVLSDTRSIYTPLYSGVFWDVQDYMLEDVDRVEVIRGPGASLWGANAVNGVINITTKSAKDTQGMYLEAGGGTEERAIAGARFGGKLSEHGYFRVFGKYFERDETFNPDTTNSDDAHLAHGGFRADVDLNSSDAITVQGDMYSGSSGQYAPTISILGRDGPTDNLRVHTSGGNVLGRWHRTLTADSDVQLRVYYDRTHRNDPSFNDDLDTLDLDLQHRFALGEAQQLTWGAGYRYTDNRNVGKGIFALSPASSQDNLISAFAQDQITLAQAWRLTLGTKLEHNDFSGFEVQPSVRMAWDATNQQTVWAAVSRAVRTPTRLERDIAVDVTDPNANPIARLHGNEDFAAEELLAYELGYRWQIKPALFIDVAAFYNSYEGLSSLEIGEPFIDPSDGRTVYPVENRNLTDGNARGVETLLTYTPLRRWRLTASYAFVDLNIDPHGTDENRGKFFEGATPEHQYGLRSFLDVTEDLQVDVLWRHIDAVRSIPDIVTGEGIPNYSQLDVRIAWHGWEQLEVSVVGQNLLDKRHPEFGTPEARGEIERGVYAKLAWGF